MNENAVMAIVVLIFVIIFAGDPPLYEAIYRYVDSAGCQP